MVGLRAQRGFAMAWLTAASIKFSWGYQIKHIGSDASTANNPLHVIC